jgi:hypothetical protein
MEVEARPPTIDLVATLKARLERKALAKAPATKCESINNMCNVRLAGSGGG